MLIFLFCVVVTGAVGLWPDLPAMRGLRRLLIDLPARTLSEFSATKTIAAFFVVVLVLAVIWFADAEATILLAQVIPEGVVWFVTFDVATYFDVIALAWLLAATIRLREAFARLAEAAGRLINSLPIRRQAGARDRSRRAPRKVAHPSQDDDGGWLVAARFTPRYA